MQGRYKKRLKHIHKLCNKPILYRQILEHRQAKNGKAQMLGVSRVKAQLQSANHTF